MLRGRKPFCGAVAITLDRLSLPISEV